MTRKILLSCGIASSLLYVVMNVAVPMQWEGYRSVSQTVSELSAIGAPTRPLWVRFGLAYTVLLTAFGFGVRASARRNRPLRVAGSLLIADGLIGLGWPPMHVREVLAAGGATMTDTMHLVFALVTVLLMLLAIGFGAAAFGIRFRRYSIATLATLAVFGLLTTMNASRVSANLPTPWVGVWERLNIGAFLLWVIVLAVTLLRAAAPTRTLSPQREARQSQFDIVQSGNSRTRASEPLRRTSTSDRQKSRASHGQ